MSQPRDDGVQPGHVQRDVQRAGARPFCLCLAVRAAYQRESTAPGVQVSEGARRVFAGQVNLAQGPEAEQALVKGQRPLQIAHGDGDVIQALDVRRGRDRRLA